jgi:acyl carrier protein
MIGSEREELTSEVLAWVEQNNRNRGENGGKIDPSMDLLSAGILDSMGFVDLIAFIEQKTGRKLELAELDPRDFTSIEGLLRSALGENGGPVS